MLDANKVRTLLVDDHRILLQALHNLLETFERLEVVGEAEDGMEAVRLSASLQPDVVVMDIAMPRLNGIDATREIKRQQPQVQVVILTMYETELYISESLKAGASGYVPKTVAGDELVQAIYAVAQGQVYLHSSVAAKVVDAYVRGLANQTRSEEVELTLREREVLQLIAEGFSNKAIARQLQLSVHTVQSHRANIMDKLAAHDRTELVRHAIRLGIIQP